MYRSEEIAKTIGQYRGNPFFKRKTSPPSVPSVKSAVESSAAEIEYVSKDKVKVAYSK